MTEQHCTTLALSLYCAIDDKRNRGEAIQQCAQRLLPQTQDSKMRQYLTMLINVNTTNSMGFTPHQQRVYSVLNLVRGMRVEGVI